MNDIVKIGIIGDFDEKKSSHKATNEALYHCAASLSMDIAIKWLPTENLTGDLQDTLGEFDALWCSPGSPYRSYQGAINAIRFAREMDIPFIGTCGGFQHAILEYAQNVLKIADVYHAEYNPDASNFFISALSCSLVGETRKIYLKESTQVYIIYNTYETLERYNCNFGLNVDYQNTFEQSGFRVAGTDENQEVRILELPEKRFYIATLFQPQLSSTPEIPHKLIISYLLATKKFRIERMDSQT